MADDVTLVTGGAGFLGRHVVAVLRDRDIHLRVLDTQPGHGVDGLDWVQGSVTDESVVRDALEGVSSVVHLAAIPHLWTRDMRDFGRVNHVGTRVMLDAARSQGVSAFVHVSSLTTRVFGSVGRQERSVRETDIPPLDQMLGPYPRSKWLAEEAARSAKSEGMPVRIAIPTMPLGPGDTNLTPPTRMILDFVQGKTPAFLETWMNIADVRDMAGGIVDMLGTETPSEGVFLGGKNLRLSELLQALEHVSGIKMPTSKVPGFVAEAFAHADEFVSTYLTHTPPKAPVTGVRLARRPVTFDMSLAQDLLPAPTFSLEDTLGDTLDWFQREGLRTGA
ncbi:MAG: NAD-dependent epimerase/dehydratase family protein [Candidatus Phaeomarinobacter sp.]